MTSAQRLDQARELVAIVREMARTTILPRYLRAVREHKADGSVLTEADLAAQAALVESLPTLIHAPVLGEEMSAEEQGRVWHAGVHGLWVIDPIDGTTNFANGIPFFGVAVAYLVSHKTQIGVVYNPVTDEAFYAARGAGAWLNDVSLPLRSPAGHLREAVAGVDFKRISHHLGDEPRRIDAEQAGDDHRHAGTSASPCAGRR